MARVRSDTDPRDGELFAHGLGWNLCHAFFDVVADVPASKPLLGDTHVAPPLLRITYTGYRVGISGKTNRHTREVKLACSCPRQAKQDVSLCKLYITMTIICCHSPLVMSETHRPGRSPDISELPSQSWLISAPAGLPTSYSCLFRGLGRNPGAVCGDRVDHAVDTPLVSDRYRQTSAGDTPTTHCGHSRPYWLLAAH